MLQENLLKIYETSFRENREMSALTDYFKGETFSYYEMAKEIAKIHLLFKKAGIKQGDKIALIGRNNPRWCITYMGTITYGAVIVPILQDFTLRTSSISSTTRKAACCSWATTSGT